MIITKTPLRIGFVGGGTDIPEYYRKHGGLLVSAAINKYIYIVVNKKFDDEIRISYSKTEMVKTVNEIEHPSIREALKLLNIDGGIEILSISDIPSTGTGLGSSSTFLVGLLNALHAYKSEFVSREDLAREAVKIEREILREPGGKQDQYMAAHGGIQLIEFKKNEEVSLKRINIKGEELSEFNDQLLMFYTGIERKSAEVHRDQGNKIDDNLPHYDRMRDIAFETYDALINKKYEELGKLMDENWQLKKNLSNHISNGKIDDWYSTAKKSGARGGKLIGAGGGGFLLFTAPLESQNHVMNSLNMLERYRFQIENLGSRVIYLE